jgi:hypothetical protein
LIFKKIVLIFIHEKKYIKTNHIYKIFNFCIFFIISIYIDNLLFINKHKSLLTNNQFQDTILKCFINKKCFQDEVIFYNNLEIISESLFKTCYGTDNKKIFCVYFSK